MKKFLLLAGCLMASVSMMAQDNLMAKANEGATGDKGAMAANGWQCWKFPFSGSGNNITFGTPEQLSWDSNGPGGNNVRWENKSNVVTYEGSPYTDNVCFTRWDNGSMHNYWYVYPVEITTPGTYTLSVLAGPWSNLSTDSDNSYLKASDNKTAYIGILFSKDMGPQGITWNSSEDKSYSVLGEPEEGEGKIFVLPKTDSNDHASLTKCETNVLAPSVGTYYVELLGSHAITVTADYSLTLNESVSVMEIEDAAEVVEIEYYGIDGVRLVNPTKGSLVIEKRVLSNGNIKVRKSVIR